MAPLVSCFFGYSRRCAFSTKKHGLVQQTPGSGLGGVGGDEVDDLGQRFTDGNAPSRQSSVKRRCKRFVSEASVNLKEGHNTEMQRVDLLAKELVPWGQE